jgi:hypothetical protein
VISDAVIQSGISSRLVLRRKTREDVASCLWGRPAEPRDTKYELRTDSRFPLDPRTKTTRPLLEREFVPRMAVLRRVSWGGLRDFHIAEFQSGVALADAGQPRSAFDE